MDWRRLADDARAACLTSLGVDVRIVLEIRREHVMYSLHSRKAPFAHVGTDPRYVIDGPHRASVTVDACRRMTPARRVRTILDQIKEDLVRNGAFYDQIAEAMVDHGGELGTLRDLKVELTWSSGRSGTVRAAWTGMGNDLAIGPQTHHVEHDLDAGPSPLRAKLLGLARRDARLRDLTGTVGIRLDPPLDAFLRSVGRTAGDLVAAARRHGYCRPRMSRHDPAPAPMEFEGRTLSLTFTDGLVSSRFQLGYGVTWSKGCLTARGLVLPQSVISSIGGRPLREIVDHPWLDGLVAGSATQTTGRSGTCVTIMAKAA